MVKRILARFRQLMDDPRWWGFYLQRRFMQPARRERIARLVARRRPPTEVPADDESIGRSITELNDEGYTLLGQLLSPNVCAELRHYFARCEVSDPYRAESQRFLPEGEGRHPEAHVAYHEAADVLRAPHLLALANDEKILGIVSRFLGCKPTIGYMTAWWSYWTPGGAKQAEFFHRDVDDWKFVKLFVYLSDVGLENGPHVYVQHSASKDSLAQIRRFTDDEVRLAFGPENLITMTGRAGEGFLENTFGLHKGQPVQSGRRLIFQTVYGVSALPYGPQKPVMSLRAAAVPGLDPWINRVYLS